MDKLSEFNLKVLKSSLSWANNIQEFRMFLRNLNSHIMYIIDSYTKNDYIDWDEIFDKLWITKKEECENKDDLLDELSIEKEKIIQELVLEVLNSKKKKQNE